MDVADESGQPVAAALAAAVLRRAPELADQLVETIGEHNPGYRAVNAVPASDLWRSCHDNITRVLQLLLADGTVRGGGPEDYYDAARATGHQRAVQRMPLDDVLRSFRLGGRLVWQALIAEARVQGVADSEGLPQLRVVGDDTEQSGERHVFPG